jgi:RimJ/RimL family protein N-acetyltransferase
MKTPILETERITLRPPTVADAQTAFDNWASDPLVLHAQRNRRDFRLGRVLLER